jgi:hemoglobin
LIIYKSDIHNFFPQDKEEFDKVKVKNTKFFVQLCGGPKVYEQESGGMDEDIKEDFWQYCDKFSKLTVNQFPEKREFNPYH